MSITAGDMVGDREKGRAAHNNVSNTHIETANDASGGHQPASAPGFVDVASGAIAGTESEKRMGIIQGFKTYPKAVGWSILLSTAIIMEGYDVTLLPNLFNQASFQHRFGVPDGKGGYQVEAAWQSGLTNGANVGEIIGLFITGLVAERVGYRWTMITSLALVAGFIFIAFFTQNLPTLLIAEIFCGIPWGVFQTRTSPISVSC